MKPSPCSCLLLGMLVLPAAAHAAGEGIPEEPYLRRLTPPATTRIAVTKARVFSDFGQGPEAEEACKNFGVSAKEARAFFQQAEYVSRSSYHHYYPMTGCYGEGTITYANGMRAEWEIEDGGRGILEIKNGKNKGVLYYLYCEDCP